MGKGYESCIHYGNRFEDRIREKEEDRPRRRYMPLYYRFNRFLHRRRGLYW